MAEKVIPNSPEEAYYKGFLDGLKNMKENGVIYDCVLWEKARTLARDRGLVMRAGCSVQEVCDGAYCPFVSDIGDTGPQQVERFYRKIEQHFETLEERRLSQLRKELEEEIAKQK